MEISSFPKVAWGTGCARSRMRFSTRNSPLAVILMIVLWGVSLQHCSEGEQFGPPAQDGETFRRIVVDASGPKDPWGKAIGDLDGDGFPDLIAGGHGTEARGLVTRIGEKIGIRKYEESVGELVWYRNPTWQRNLISKEYRFSTDHEVADIDGDGRADVVSLTGSHLIWFRNPDWKPFIIDTRALHDIEVADFDGDGDFDIVARNQSGFNHYDGDRLHFYRQESPEHWVHFSIPIPHGEGLKAADVNGDGRTDVVVNHFWYENPGAVRSDVPWEGRAYGRTWEWPDVSIDVADINGNGLPDIVLTPSEPEGQAYRISWFEAPEREDGEWIEHVIDHETETVHHFVGAHDMDNDGRIDIVTAQMHQGEDPDEVSIFWNLGKGLNWSKEVISSTGSHNMRAVDFDKDGDIDLFGANWSGPRQAIELWENQIPSPILSGWARHIIDDAKPWRSTFIFAEDIDGDGPMDIVTGAWWYRNPGHWKGTWERRSLGAKANNAAVVRDFDKDGTPDVLASEWKDDHGLRFHERLLKKLRLRSYPETRKGGFVWARNDGKGGFEVLSNVETGVGDFLQGAAVLADESGSEIILSWHETGGGIQALRMPDDPVHETWAWRRISDISQDEQLSVGDLDGDGDEDIILGTRWLRNDGNGEWTSFVLHLSEENPDRNRVADINGDGKPDVVIGHEAISLPGRVAWYEQGPDPTSAWAEHLVGYVIGPMSLDVGDLDEDGDLDIIVGEHNLRNPGSSRLLIFENVDGRGCDWKEHVLYIGDEHHNGAQLADMDGDGDLDIISIGWGHGRVLLYENLGWKRRERRQIRERPAPPLGARHEKK
jgi:hypothetical protein